MKFFQQPAVIEWPPGAPVPNINQIVNLGPCFVGTIKGIQVDRLHGEITGVLVAVDIHWRINCKEPIQWEVLPPQTAMNLEGSVAEFGRAYQLPGPSRNVEQLQLPGD